MSSIISPGGLRNAARTYIVRSPFVQYRVAPAPGAGAALKRTRSMLTRKQSELLRFIHERLKETGVPPSFDEMKDALFLRSKSGIHRLIIALEERGFIRRLPNRARALEVLRLPDSSTPADSGRSKRFAPSVIEGTLGRVRAWVQSDSGDDLERASISIPVMGRIAAGTPIAALQNRSRDDGLCPLRHVQRSLLASRRAVGHRDAATRFLHAPQ